MNAIQHFIVLMLENQSFDRLLGYLELDAPGHRIEGLSGTESNPLAPPHDMTPVPVAMVSGDEAYVFEPGPGHEFVDVTQQLRADRALRDASAARNDGFVLNYSAQVGADGRRIMGCLDPAALPVTSTLARNFVVCDHWFSSVPGPTWPNRFFVHAGTAAGNLVTPETAGQFASQFWSSPYRMRTIFESLLERGHDWKVYFDDYAQAFGLRNLHAQVERFQKFETFLADVEAGTLPTYSFIEPRSFSAPGYPANDQHPPHHLLEGERLIATVYDTLRRNDAVWRKCLLIVVYDEHGGFYDHVRPPRAVPPDTRVARPSGFAFDRLGVRVPALLVSPWVGEGRVDHTVYDHTSIAATLKKLLGLPAFLTARDAAANTLEGNFIDTPRSVSLTNVSALVATAPATREPSPTRFSAYQRSLLALAEMLASPPAGADVSSPAVMHARSVLDTPQGP